MSPSTAPASTLRAGLPIALLSAASFGLSGPVARSLLDAGWSSAAVAMARIGGAAVVLLVPTVFVLLRARREALAWGPRVVIYGVVAIAGAQLCFFTAIQHTSVSSALLIEYLAPVLLIFWTWLRTRRAPGAVVGAGAAIAVAGLICVIGPGGGSFSVVGTLWAFGAALCLTAYFGMAASTRGPQPPALVLTGSGMIVGAAVAAGAGLTGILGFRTGDTIVQVGSWTVSFLVPASFLALVCALFAYLTGILSVRMLGGRRASFISLSEVMFALIAAWILLGEQPTVQQGIGALIVLAGVAVVGIDENRARAIVVGAWLRAVDLFGPSQWRPQASRTPAPAPAPAQQPAPDPEAAPQR